MKHRKVFQTTSKPGLVRCSGSSMAETCLLAMRCPVFRGRDSSLGSHTELENLTGDAKGKGTSGDPVRLKVLMRRAGADCSVVATKWGNARGAKGAGHPRRDRWVNGKPEEPTGFGRRRQPSLGGTSRINREVYVRFCEGLGAKLPGPTRRNDRGDRGDVGIIRSPVRASIPPDCGGRGATRVPTATRNAINLTSLAALFNQAKRQVVPPGHGDGFVNEPRGEHDR